MTFTTLAVLFAASAIAQDTTVVLIVHLEDETAKVAHDRSEPLDLGGWTLVSEVGGQTFTFPTGVRLAPGDTVTVTSGPDARDEPPNFLRWTGRHVWNNEGDPGALLDAEGTVVARSVGSKDVFGNPNPPPVLTPAEHVKEGGGP